MIEADLSVRELVDLARPIITRGLERAFAQTLSGHAASCSTDGGNDSRRFTCVDLGESCDPFEGIPLEDSAALVTAIAPLAERGGVLGVQARRVMVLCSARFAAEIVGRTAERAAPAGIALTDDGPGESMFCPAGARL